jgi:5-dehydro-2-deoxygluconokinase
VAQTEKERGLEGRIGVLIDDRYGQDALNAATGRGWWIGRPVELPGSMPLVFDHGRSIGTTLIEWPREHVAKCLVHYHPDHPHRSTLWNRKRRFARSTTRFRPAGTNYCLK